MSNDVEYSITRKLEKFKVNYIDFVKEGDIDLKVIEDDGYTHVYKRYGAIEMKISDGNIFDVYFHGDGATRFLNDFEEIAPYTSGECELLLVCDDLSLILVNIKDGKSTIDYLDFTVEDILMQLHIQTKEIK